MTNAATGALNAYFGFTTANIAQGIVTERVDFGGVIIKITGGETRVTNVPLANPQIPQADAFVFVHSRTLWVSIKAQKAPILLDGGKLNYWQKRVVV